MKLHFLAADVALTKKITPEGNTPYPNVANFSSFTHDITTLEQHFEFLVAHANMGHCALKGTLHRELRDESRAGSTKTTDSTQWLCLDIDGLDASLDDFMTALGLQDTSHIVQWSASSGFSSGLRCHVFVHLRHPVPAPTLKLWLKKKNLTTDLLNRNISLSASGMTLSYPLDITACQNDKLIYISPPTLVNRQDPHPERITLVKRGNDLLEIDTQIHSAQIDELEAQKINELRVDMGMRRRKPSFKTRDGHRYLSNPNQATVMLEKIERGFVYLSFNGESYPYWFPQNNPTFLHNWKEEPIVLLQDICPEYYEDYRSRLNPDENPIVPIVFRELKTDAYYNGTWNEAKQDLQLFRVANKDRMADFMALHHTPMPDPVPDWSFDFNPQDLEPINFEKRTANKFRPTKYLVNAPKVDQCPPGIEKLIRSITGDDEEIFNDFCNWLAYVYQMRQKPGTAWILHGVEGTGKGLFFHNVLVPTLGAEYCKIVTLGDFNDSFNEWLESCLLLFVDEVHLGSNDSKTLNKLKNLITEPVGRIRAMRTNAYQVPLYNAMIFASNDRDAMYMSETDRRFWIANRQENKLDITSDEIDALRGELLEFTGFMMHYEVDHEAVRQPKDTVAKNEMRLDSLNSCEQFFWCFRTGDISPLLEMATGNPPIHKQNQFQTCRQILGNWADQANTGQEVYITRDDLYAVYEYIQSAKEMTINQFARLLSANDIKMKVVRQDGHVFRAFVRPLAANKDSLIIFRTNNKVVPIGSAQHDS